MEKHKKWMVPVLLVLLVALLVDSARLHAGSTAVPGSDAKSDPVGKRIIPAIDLPMPASEQAKKYLGLSGAGSFKIGQIKAPVLIIEIFSLY
ncbi:MAG: hypothetical protein AB1558_05860 [Thermodesulfobacteriota bacterium]